MKKVSVSASPASTAGGGLKVNSMVRSDRALYAVLSWLDVRHCVCSRHAVGEREPVQPSCVENFGLGTRRPSAAPGLQQPAAKCRNTSATGGFRGGRKMEISGTNVPVTFHLEGKPLTSHDCTVIWHLLKRINTFSVQTAPLCFTTWVLLLH